MLMLLHLCYGFVRVLYSVSWSVWRKCLETPCSVMGVRCGAIRLFSGDGVIQGSWGLVGGIREVVEKMWGDGIGG